MHLFLFIIDQSWLSKDADYDNLAVTQQYISHYFRLCFFSVDLSKKIFIFICRPCLCWTVVLGLLF